MSVEVSKISRPTEFRLGISKDKQKQNSETLKVIVDLDVDFVLDEFLNIFEIYWI